jgi:hypothetical protein
MWMIFDLKKTQIFLSSGGDGTCESGAGSPTEGWGKPFHRNSVQFFGEKARGGAGDLMGDFLEGHGEQF